MSKKEEPQTAGGIVYNSALEDIANELEKV
jgi:hypothetical protein